MRASEHWDEIQQHPGWTDLTPWWQDKIVELRADLSAAEQREAMLLKNIEEWENREGACCPEDAGFDEYIKSLSSRLSKQARIIAGLVGALEEAKSGEWGEILAWIVEGAPTPKQGIKAAKKLVHLNILVDAAIAASREGEE